MIVGEQRIDGAALPAEFSVPYDDAAIDTTHSYALYASVVDGDDDARELRAGPGHHRRTRGRRERPRVATSRRRRPAR